MEKLKKLRVVDGIFYDEASEIISVIPVGAPFLICFCVSMHKFEDEMFKSIPELAQRKNKEYLADAFVFGEFFSNVVGGAVGITMPIQLYKIN